MQYNQDSKFWHFATLVADFILLNLLFIVLCIPVVTIGPAISALIHTTLKLSEDENRTLIKPFWNEFKRDITKKILLWIVYLILIAAMVYMAQFYFADGKMKDAYVSDYYTLEKLDAKDAFYVHGSNVYGPMGDEFIPFKDEAKAESFLKDHAGKGVIRFDEIKNFIGK